MTLAGIFQNFGLCSVDRPESVTREKAKDHKTMNH